jgi:preprotein translocase subunit SecF
MLHIIDKKWWYFIFSGLVIIPGLISLVVWGLKPGIDFTGGTLLEVRLQKGNTDQVKKTISDQKIDIGSLQQTGNYTYLLRSKSIDKDQNKKLQDEMKSQFGTVEELRYETVGPSIGQETTLNAVKAVIVASIVIVLYIAFAFRHIPKPYSSFKFGVCALVALIHDVLVVIGIFSIFGHFFNVEIDSLFITALLTVMGFSVHDTIVVFDRIRENLGKMDRVSFAIIVNESIVQTLARSLSTSLTVLFTLLALLLFGGESIHWFLVALLIGVTSGTYSSIFNAAPLLVLWEEKREKKKK